MSTDHWQNYVDMYLPIYNLRISSLGLCLFMAACVILSSTVHVYNINLYVVLEVERQTTKFLPTNSYRILETCHAYKAWEQGWVNYQWCWNRHTCIYVPVHTHVYKCFHAYIRLKIQKVELHV